MAMCTTDLQAHDIPQGCHEEHLLHMDASIVVPVVVAAVLVSALTAAGNELPVAMRFVPAADTHVMVAAGNAQAAATLLADDRLMLAVAMVLTGTVQQRKAPQVDGTWPCEPFVVPDVDLVHQLSGKVCWYCCAECSLDRCPRRLEEQVQLVKEAT